MTSCLILAAGEGFRLRPLTNDRPKGLVPLLGKSLVTHQTEVLNAAGINQISIVTGYQASKINTLDYPTFHNRFYNRTNMVESLFTARSFLEKAQGDVLVSYADIVYEYNNLKTVLNTAGDIAVMVDDGWLDLWSVRNENPISDAETLKLDKNDNIFELGRKPKSFAEIEGQYTGLIKISKSKILDLISFYNKLDRKILYRGDIFEKMYMTNFLQLLIDAKWSIKAAHVNHGWLEIDTTRDIQIYEHLSSIGKLDALWRAHD